MRQKVNGLRARARVYRLASVAATLLGGIGLCTALAAMALVVSGAVPVVSMAVMGGLIGGMGGIGSLMIAPNLRAKALLYYGREMVELADYPRAMAYLNKAATLAPYAPSVYIARSMAYKGLGHVDLAFEDADRAVNLAPDLVAGRLARARLFADYGLLEEAREDLLHALEQHPAWSVGYLELAQVQLALNDPEGSLRALDTLVSRLPDDPEITYDALILAGKIYEENLNDLDAAIESYSRAIPLAPDRKIGYLRRSWALRIRGDLQQAAEDLLEAASRPKLAEDEDLYHWIRAQCYAWRYMITRDRRDRAAWVEALRRSAAEDAPRYRFQARQWLELLAAGQFPTLTPVSPPFPAISLN